MTTGSCLCRGIPLQIQGSLDGTALSFCGQCRKAQGTPMAASIPDAESAFGLRRGHKLLMEFEFSPGKVRVSCSRCGSPMFSKTSARPGVLRIRAGTLDGALETGPAAHVLVESKASWWEICDELPRYAYADEPKQDGF